MEGQHLTIGGKPRLRPIRHEQFRVRGVGDCHSVNADIAVFIGGIENGAGEFFQRFDVGEDCCNPFAGGCVFRCGFARLRGG